VPAVCVSVTVSFEPLQGAPAASPPSPPARHGATTPPPPMPPPPATPRALPTRAPRATPFMLFTRTSPKRCVHWAHPPRARPLPPTPSPPPPHFPRPARTLRPHCLHTMCMYRSHTVHTLPAFCFPASRLPPPPPLPGLPHPLPPPLPHPSPPAARAPQRCAQTRLAHTPHKHSLCILCHRPHACIPRSPVPPSAHHVHTACILCRNHVAHACKRVSACSVCGLFCRVLQPTPAAPWSPPLVLSATRTHAMFASGLHSTIALNMGSPCTSCAPSHFRWVRTGATRGRVAERQYNPLLLHFVCPGAREEAATAGVLAGSWDGHAHSVESCALSARPANYNGLA
jgi:hypothetical protein